MTAASKAVVHLRAQNHRKRLGLIFGSGASKDLGFPDWANLVERIGGDEGVDAAALLAQLRSEDSSQPVTQSLASITHMLFDHFRDRRIKELNLTGSITFLQEQSIKSEWLKIIHKQLYTGVDASKRKRTIEKHPYLTAFRDVIKNSPLTVNYNFDDTLEKLLIQSRTAEEQTHTRGYEVTDKPNAQFQKDSGVIYHPNGYLPSLFEDGASAEVVFSNDAFQDQLISAANGRYVHLSNHLFRNTCLLIGLSLEDATLQSLLRQNAVTNPGHIHYIVHYLPANSEVNKDTLDVIFRSNFTSYNLYTLFLDGQGIKDLAELILMHPDTFKMRYPKAVRKFVYYLVGSIGAGKSTAAGNFRNLITYDEWVDERLPDLAKPQKDVGKTSIVNMDKWIADQFHKKNFMLQKAEESIHIIDRCPLDPLTFPGDKRAKAANLLKTITSDGSLLIEKGHIIFLDCEVAELKIRNSFKHKYWPDEEIGGLLLEMEEVYSGLKQSRICTRGRTIGDVAREIAKIVFLEEYWPVDIADELQKFASAA